MQSPRETCWTSCLERLDKYLSETCSKLPAAPGFPPWLLSILFWSRAPCGGGRYHSLRAGTAVLPGVSGWPVWSQASLHTGLLALEQQMPRSAAHWPQEVWSCCGTASHLGEDWEILFWVSCGSMSHGELQVNPNEAAAAPSPRGCGGAAASGGFSGYTQPSHPPGRGHFQ